MAGNELAGRAPAWRMSFHEADDNLAGDELFYIDHTGHYAEIEVSLEEGLTPGRFAATIRRLSSEHYKTLLLAHETESEPSETQRYILRDHAFVKLKLYWRQTAIAGMGDRDVPEIAVFRITKLSRESDGLEVTTKIEGKRALHEWLKRSNIAADGTDGDPISGATPYEAARNLLAHFEMEEGEHFVIPTPDSPPPAREPINFVPQQSALASLRQLETFFVNLPPHRRGRSQYLFRENRLHIGPNRDIPETPINLAERHAVNSIEPTGSVTPLASYEVVTGSPALATRKGYKLNCVGQVGVTAGDLVSFEKDPSNEGKLGGFGLPPLSSLGSGGPEAELTTVLYVTSIRHQMGPKTGWKTEISGVSIAEAPWHENAWDEIPPTRITERPQGPRGPATSGAQRLSQSVSARISEAFAYRPVSTIGEVRSYTPQTQMDGDRVSRAAHSSSILRGFIHTGSPGQARLGDINRSSTADIRVNTPYLTPFAWGPYGQVLPRYPGMRVMLLNNQRNSEDPLDVGSLWKTNNDNDTTAPAVSEMGDWWLILPAFESDPPATADGVNTLELPDARASHDLVTAKGHRAIHVKSLDISVDEHANMLEATARPPIVDDSGQDDHSALVLRHSGAGSHIKLFKNGDIEIEAGGNMKFTADNIELVARGSGTVDIKNG